MKQVRWGRAIKEVDMLPPTACPKCQGSLTAGFIIDANMRGGTTVSTWQEGAPQRSIWTGIKQRVDEQRETTTYRCEQCGYLETYALS